MPEEHRYKLSKYESVGFSEEVMKCVRLAKQNYLHTLSFKYIAPNE